MTELRRYIVKSWVLLRGHNGEQRLIGGTIVTIFGQISFLIDVDGGVVVDKEERVTKRREKGIRRLWMMTTLHSFSAL